MKFDLPGRRVEWFPSLDSTMPSGRRTAAWLAKAAHPVRTVVRAADRQTAGIGRTRDTPGTPGRTCAGLYVSIVLRLALGPESRCRWSGNAGPWGSRHATPSPMSPGLAPDLRWPNDVLLGEKEVRRNSRADGGRRRHRRDRHQREHCQLSAGDRAAGHFVDDGRSVRIARRGARPFW